MAIQELLGRLFWALDTGDAKAVFACFTPDGTLIQGSGGKFSGEELRKWAEEENKRPAARGRQHVAHPLYFYQKGDAWVMRSYFQILHTDPATGKKEIRNMSYSEDTVVKTGQGWRIRERRNGSWDPDKQPWVGA
jgi:hypothetical protein